MKTKPYSSYKDSGIEWLGEMPTHWEVKRLKNVIRANITDGPHETPVFIDKGIPFLSVDGIQEGELTFENCRYISIDAHHNYSKKAKIEIDDILLGKAASIGKVARVKVEFEFSIWSPLALIKPKLSEITPAYLEFLLKSTLTQYQIQQLSTLNTQQNISMRDIPKFIFLMPNIEEQTAIANFLDRETSRIDNLINEKANFIKLLKEKRQALITHAVTKGLDLNAKMKDSEVEWIGNVPEHWVVCAIKHIVLIPITDGPHETPNFYDEGIPFVSAEAVSSGIINFEKIRGFISHEDHLKYSQKYKPKQGDIFMIKSGATTGITAIVETDIDFNIWSPLAVIRCNEKSHPYFVLNFMRSYNFQEAVALNWSFGTQQNIGMGVIENLSVTVPPIEEQTTIANFLDRETSKIDMIVNEVNHSIDLLKEHRSALISAAVTGKIDVRDQHTTQGN